MIVGQSSKFFLAFLIIKRQYLAVSNQTTKFIWIFLKFNLTKIKNFLQNIEISQIHKNTEITFYFIQHF